MNAGAGQAARCGSEGHYGGVVYFCERAPHSVDDHSLASRHAAQIDAELARFTDEGDGHGTADLVTWEDDGEDGDNWEIEWGTVEQYARSTQ